MENFPAIGDRVSIEHNRQFCGNQDCPPYEGYVIDRNKKLGNFTVQSGSSKCTFRQIDGALDRLTIHEELKR